VVAEQEGRPESLALVKTAAAASAVIVVVVIVVVVPIARTLLEKEHRLLADQPKLLSSH
jgi:hypothetical protein